MKTILRLAAALVLAALFSTLARAQMPTMSKTQPIQRDQPAFYQADEVDYDRDGATVALSGHVEIWQGDRVLRADRVTYDRNTGVAAATGNVALVEPKVDCSLLVPSAMIGLGQRLSSTGKVSLPLARSVPKDLPAVASEPKRSRQSSYTW